MKIYVAGPMRGLPGLNFGSFDEAADTLRADGHEVVSPAEIDRELGLDPNQPLPASFTIEDAMRRDLRAVTECDAIALLPGWESSEGVRHELAAARACGLGIFEYQRCPSGIGFRVGPMHTAPIASDQERIIVDPVTGGRKGQKLARFDLVPWDVMRELAEHFGRGAEKHGDSNWTRGYAWSLNLAALHRHLSSWWLGEDTDPETGSCHLLAVIWHAVALRWFQLHGKGTDDRPVRS